MLSTLMKKSKQAYYNKYFETNWNDTKNTWKGIKSLISFKTVGSSAPTVLSCDNDNIITNNTLTNPFASIAESTKNNIKYSHKHFSDYLKEECESTIFLKSAGKNEIGNIISFLKSVKVSGPNSTPDLFNLSFVTGIFP